VDWIVAVDVHDRGPDVIDGVRRLAVRTGARLHLRTVSLLGWDGEEAFGEAKQALLAEWRKYRDQEAAQLAELASKLPAAAVGSIEVLGGKPGPALLDAAAGFDGICLGTHGRQGLRRTFLGSVAEWVVRHSEGPVWVLHMDVPAIPEDGPLKVVAPIDAHEPDVRPLKEALRWLRGPVDVHAVHALRASLPYDGLDGLAHVTAHQTDQQRDWAIEQVAAALADADIPATTHCITALGSNPARDLGAFAEDQGARLIVMGTHGRKNLARLAFGSVAERLVRFSPCTTLVVR